MFSAHFDNVEFDIRLHELSHNIFDKQQSRIWLACSGEYGFCVIVFSCRCDVQKSLTRRHNFQCAKLQSWKSPPIIIIRHDITTHPQQVKRCCATHSSAVPSTLSAKTRTTVPPSPALYKPTNNSQPRPGTLFRSSP